MAKTFESELRTAEREAQKLRKTLKRADLDYTVQISMNSAQPGEIHYALSMTAPAKGLAPIMFIAKSIDDLTAMIKTAQDKFNPIAVERAYHESQIDACEKTKLGHEERLKELDKEEAEDGKEE